MTAIDKLAELGLTLPPPPTPAGAYTRAVRSERQIFVSGQLPMANGAIQYAGALGRDLDIAAGYAAAKLCALNALSILQAESNDLDTVRILRIGGYVCSVDSFIDQAQVINGASELFAAVLGERGVHARLAIGVAALPLGAAVELEVIAELTH